MLFVGVDWARDHHDVERVDEQGNRLAYKRFPEGLVGLSGLHALIAQHLPAEWADLPPEGAASRVKIGIESDHGVWVQALVAAGYEVFAINPFSAGTIARDTRHRARSPTQPTHTCWPRSCGWTVRITARWPRTPIGQRRSSPRPGPTKR
jgi:transposase